MKELSIEEKAKRYDEAIKIARSKIRNDKNHVLYEKDIIDILSELKESEDERIRKELIQYLKDNPTNLPGGQYCRDDFFRWLEKQGEQKSNPYSGVSFEYNGHTWGMCARDGGVDIGYDKQLIVHINPIQEKDEFDDCIKAIDNKLTGYNTGDFITATPSNHGI